MRSISVCIFSCSSAIIGCLFAGSNVCLASAIFLSLCISYICKACSCYFSRKLSGPKGSLSQLLVILNSKLSFFERTSSKVTFSFFLGDLPCAGNLLLTFFRSRLNRESCLSSVSLCFLTYSRTFSLIFLHLSSSWLSLII